MRPLDAEKTVREIVAQLDSETLLSRFREWERGGLPASSMSDGRGSAETPCPVAVSRWDADWIPRLPDAPLRGDTGRVLGPSDAIDRQIRSDRLEYEQALRHMATAGQTALRITNAYLIARTDDTAKNEALSKPPPGAGPCGNAMCNHTCTGKENDRLRKAPTRSGGDPAKANVARCQACDTAFRRHGKERDARVREVKVKLVKPAAATVAARNFVAQNPKATPFVVACAKRLDADPGWLPSDDQTELLLELAARPATSNQRTEKVS